VSRVYSAINNRIGLEVEGGTGFALRASVFAKGYAARVAWQAGSEVGGRKPDKGANLRLPVRSSSKSEDGTFLSQNFRSSKAIDAKGSYCPSINGRFWFRARLERF